MTLAFLEDASDIVLVSPTAWARQCARATWATRRYWPGAYHCSSRRRSCWASWRRWTATALRRRLGHYAAPDLPLIDEVGHLSISTWRSLVRADQPALPAQEHGGDHEQPLRRVGQVFPNAARRLVDRPADAPGQGCAYRGQVLSPEGGRPSASRAQGRTRGAQDSTAPTQGSSVVSGAEPLNRRAGVGSARSLTGSA